MRSAASRRGPWPGRQNKKRVLLARVLEPLPYRDRPWTITNALVVVTLISLAWLALWGAL
jgi:hypothetical protein